MTSCTCFHLPGDHKPKGVGPCQALDSYDSPCGCPSYEEDPNTDEALAPLVDDKMKIVEAKEAAALLRWQDIEPKDAVDIDLSERTDITAPLNEAGERCPWPWDPQQLVGAPMGQYHCRYCGAMCLAGVPHPDYSDASGP